MKIIDYLLHEFGFEGFTDFFISTFGIMFSKNSILLGMVLGFSFNSLVGLEPALLLTIIGLFLLEIVTGTVASIYFQDEKFDKEKLSRSIIKLFAYPILLIIIQQFKNFEIGTVGVMDMNINFFDLAHTALIFLVVLQVLISFLENLSLMGFKELDIVTKIFKMKLRKVADKQGVKVDEEPKEEKEAKK
jgi:hypothetical protein